MNEDKKEVVCVHVFVGVYVCVYMHMSASVCMFMGVLVAAHGGRANLV